MAPPEEAPGLVAASDEAVVVVHHVHHHHSPPPSSVIIAHGDHKRKRTKHSVANGALPPHCPQELTAARSTIDADHRGATEPATPMGGAHRSQRRAPAPERMDAGVSSSNDDNKALSPSVAPPPASTSIKAIRVKHSSSLFVIGGKRYPAAGSCSSPGGGSHSSYHANSHAAAVPSSSSSKSLTIRGPAAPPPPPPPPVLHIPAKARRPPSTTSEPSAVVPLEPGNDERFRRGVEVFGEWDDVAQQAAVNRFVRHQSPPKGDGFSFWLTPEEVEADLMYVQDRVEEARKTTSKAASGSGKPRRH